MVQYLFNELIEKLQFMGRVYADESANTVFMNWTCSGFRCRFVGKKVRARLTGIPQTLLGLEHAYVGVELDDTQTLQKRICVEEGSKWYTLFADGSSCEHELRLWKLSENFRGKCGIDALEIDGELLQAQPSGKMLLEFVGDSITCGFGNEAADKDSPFLTSEQNGLLSYAFIASRILNADASCICVSGISTAMNRDARLPLKLHGMNELYEFTDRIYEEEAEKQEYRVWDFKKRPAKAVIINLGTNDVNAYKMGEDKAQAKEFFSKSYRELIQAVRQKNGGSCFILCTLGPLDYYLFDEIKEITEKYRQEAADSKIECFKLGGVIQWSEGYGALMHPSVATHERMGRELAQELKKYL